MKIKHLTPDTLFDSNPYAFTQVVVTKGKRLIHCSGQTACDKNMNFVGVGDWRRRPSAPLPTWDWPSQPPALARKTWRGYGATSCSTSPITCLSSARRWPGSLPRSPARRTP